MNASSESGLWAIEISRMAAEVAASDCWVLTECRAPFGEDYVVGKEEDLRWRKRCHPAASPAAAATLSASPGRKGITAWLSTSSNDACVKTASQMAPALRINRLPAAAASRAGPIPRPLRR